MIIRKINFKEKSGTVVIKTEEDCGTSNKIETNYEIKEEPHKDFVNALNALAPHVWHLIEEPAGWDGKILVQGVSFSYSMDSDVKGACITALVSLESANSPLVINTPFMPYSQYSEGGASPTMPNSTQAIERL